MATWGPVCHRVRASAVVGVTQDTIGLRESEINQTSCEARQDISARVCWIRILRRSFFRVCLGGWDQARDCV